MHVIRANSQFTWIRRTNKWNRDILHNGIKSLFLKDKIELLYIWTKLNNIRQQHFSFYQQHSPTAFFLRSNVSYLLRTYGFLKIPLSNWFSWNTVHSSSFLVSIPVEYRVTFSKIVLLICSWIGYIYYVLSNLNILRSRLTSLILHLAIYGSLSKMYLKSSSLN